MLIMANGHAQSNVSTHTYANQDYEMPSSDNLCYHNGRPEMYETKKLRK